MNIEYDLVFLDVDGTLTDGGLFIDDNGIETKRFSVKDGYAIKKLIKNEIKIVIITGRISRIVKKRAAELGIKYVFQGINDKKSLVQKLLKEFNCKKSLYIGDDDNDLLAMKLCNFICCPKDASPKVLEIADYISNINGGYGAVRDILDYLEREINSDRI